MSSTQRAQTQVQGAELLGEEQRAGPWAGKEVAFTEGLPVATHLDPPLFAPSLT